MRASLDTTTSPLKLRLDDQPFTFSGGMDDPNALICALRDIPSRCDDTIVFDCLSDNGLSVYVLTPDGAFTPLATGEEPPAVSAPPAGWVSTISELGFTPTDEDTQPLTTHTPTHAQAVQAPADIPATTPATQPPATVDAVTPQTPDTTVATVATTTSHSQEDETTPVSKRPRWVKIAAGAGVLLAACAATSVLTLIAAKPAKPPITAPTTPAVAASGRGNYVCYPGKDSKGLTCQGMDTAGQTGSGKASEESASTTIDVLKGQRISALDTATQTACAATSKGVWCWGSGLSGEGPQPVAKIEGLAPKTPITHLAVGVAHACGATNTQVWCWGHNEEGQTTSNDPKPVLIKGLPDQATIIGLSTDGYATYVTLSNGAVWGWGNNGYHQFPTADQTAAPTQVSK